MSPGPDAAGHAAGRSAPSSPATASSSPAAGTPSPRASTRPPTPRSSRSAAPAGSSGRFSLDGCVLYASCEPCPMCLAAAYWARVDRLVYAAGRDDAARAGFDDAFIYDQVPLPAAERSLPTASSSASEATAVFDDVAGEAGPRAVLSAVGRPRRTRAPAVCRMGQNHRDALAPRPVPHRRDPPDDRPAAPDHRHPRRRGGPGGRPVRAADHRRGRRRRRLGGGRGRRRGLQAGRHVGRPEGHPRRRSSGPGSS